MGLSGLGGSEKVLLTQYDISNAQSSFDFSVPSGYRWVVIEYMSYINEPNYVYSALIRAEENIQSGSLSSWYGSGSGTLRGRRYTYNAENRTISFGQAGRYDSAGWASDNRVCPVYRIWGIN